MAKKQFKSAPESTPAAAGAAATKSKPAPAAKTPRVTAARHSRVQETSSAVTTDSKPAGIDRQEVEEILTQPVSVEAILPIESSKAEVTETTAITSASAPSVNSRAAIEKLAYSYYEARGYSYGDPLADWVRAEREYGSK